MTTRRAASFFAAVVLAGCGSLGQESEWSNQVLAGGAGPFRLSTREETGVGGTPLGRFLVVGESTGRAALTPDAVFYEAALASAAPPARDPALAGWEIDWAQYEPRRIVRSTTRVVDADGFIRHGFAAGADVLVATEAFEAGGVYEPAIVQLASGAVRLYYATAQGLGVAEAPGVDGTFTRLVTTPIFPDVEGRGPAQHPSVVILPDGRFHLYASAGGAIFHADSLDGVSFSLIDADPSTPAIDPLSLPAPVVERSDSGMPDLGVGDAGAADAGVPVVEVSVQSPSVVATRSQTGRLNVRLYFESRRDDGTSVIAVAGSFDGASFVRSGVVPYARNNPTRPSVMITPEGVSMLTFGLQRPGGGVIVLASVLSLTPSSATLDPLP